MATKEIKIQITLAHIYKPHYKLEHIKKVWIQLAMDHHKNHITATAHSLGISRATLYRKLGEMNATDSK